MKELQKVALIGAGAIGGYFIHGFATAPESIAFRVVADGERGERLKENGIRVNGVVYHPQVTSTEKAGIQDLVILAVKYGSLPEACRMLKALVGPDTLVLATLNGVDSEEIVGDAIGREHVLHSVMKVTAKRLPGEVLFQTASNLGIYFGTAFPEIAAGQEACDRLENLLQKTRVAYSRREDILFDMWFKYACNVSANLPQAIFGIGAGCYVDSEHARFLSQKLWDEVRALAATRGVELRERVRVWKECDKSSRFSTLQDIDAGRPTEIEMFAGTLMRMSEAEGLETPFAEYTYHAIKLLEEKNAGKFDYPD